MPHVLSLSQGTWDVAATAAGSLRTLDDLATRAPSWIQATGVTTAAAAQREMGAWSDAMASRRFDGEDWWWRTTFAKPQGNGEFWLCFDGIATIAEVWLNGTSLFSSRNMFRRYETDVSELLQASNELVIVCKSLDAELAKKRPRPRWRAPMIENQQLR